MDAVVTNWPEIKVHEMCPEYMAEVLISSITDCSLPSMHGHFKTIMLDI